MTLYVFNSGRRDRYIANALNTLFLPLGATNTYRYQAFGDRVNIAAGDVQAFLSLPKGTDAAVIFIDRYTATGYKYYPIRRCRLVSCARHEGRLFFTLALDDFCWPHTPDVFSHRFFAQLSNAGIPRLTNNNPENVNDGNYAVLGPSAFDDPQLFLAGDVAWETMTSALSTTRALGSTDHEHVLFARVQLRKSGSSEPLSPSLSSDDVAHYPIGRGRSCALHLNYRFPAQDLPAPGRASVVLRPSQNIFPLASNTVRVDSIADHALISLTGRKYAEDNYGVLDFDYPAAGGSTTTVISPDASIRFDVNDSWQFWIVLVIVIALFAAGSLLLGMKAPDSWAEVKKQFSWWLALGAFLHAVALFVITRWVGKKVW